MNMKAFATYLMLAGSVIFGRYGKFQDYVKIGENPKDNYELTIPGDSPAYGTPEDYYLLVSGDSEARHIANISCAYTSALEGGAKREKVKILSPTFMDVKGLQAIMPYPIDGEPTPENINSALEYMAEKVDGNDRLFVYLTDHGSIDTIIFKELNGKTYPYRKFVKNSKVHEVRIKEEDIQKMGIRGNAVGDTACFPFFSVTYGKNCTEDIYYAHEFRERLDSIKCSEGIILTGFCYSGPFAEAISGGKFTAVASSAEESYSEIGDSFDGFFVKCLSPRDYGDKDADGDGNVSVAEAVEYARKKHSWSRADKDTVPMRKPVIAGERDPAEVHLYRNAGRKIDSFEERVRCSSPDRKKEIKALIVDNYNQWLMNPCIARAYQVMLENGADPYLLSNDTADFMFPVEAPATRQNVVKALRGLGKSCGNEDVLFLYLAGDGICEDRWDTTGLDMPKPGNYAYLTESGYIDIPELKNLLEGIDTGTKIGIFDFHGGDVFAEKLSGYLSNSISTWRKDDGVGFSNPYYSFGGYLINSLGRGGNPSLEEALNEAFSADDQAGRGVKKPVIRGKMKPSDVHLKP